MAQINTEVKKTYEELESGLQNLLQSNEYMAFLDTMAKHYRYSFANTVLIYLQKPDATFVAGYQKFKNQYGHQVQKNEQAIKILAPIIYKNRKKDNHSEKDITVPLSQKEEKEDEQYLAGFRVVHVFDISQTKPIIIRDKENKEQISSKAQTLINSLAYLQLTEIWAEDDEYVDQLLRTIKYVISIPIIEKELNKSIGGYFSYKDKTNLHIVLNSKLGNASKLSTLIHEWTHYKLHNPYDENANKNIEKNDKEIQAESVTYIVMKHFSIDTSCDSLKYVASWSKSKTVDDLKKSISEIQVTAAELIEEIEAGMVTSGYGFATEKNQKLKA